MSQTDAAKGFGGKYGVLKDRQDKVGEPPSSVCVWGGGGGGMKQGVGKSCRGGREATTHMTCDWCSVVCCWVKTPANGHISAVILS